MNTRRVVGVGLCVLLAAGGVALAQSKGAAPADRPYQPPVLRFEKPLTLLEAVRLTLDNEPNLKLQAADSRFREGAAQSSSGQFDWLLQASGQFQHDESELGLSTQQSEQRNRQKIDALIPQTQVLVDSLDQAIKNLKNPNFVTAPSTFDLTTGVQNDEVRRELTRLQTEIVTLADLINRTADPVLRQQLAGLQNDLLATSTAALQATFNDVKGLPDQLRQTRKDMGDAPKDQLSESGQVQLNLSRQLRSGPILAVYSNLNYSHQNYVGKTTTDPRKGGQGVPDLYHGQVGLNLTLPLRRGLGSAEVAAPERSARREFEASKLSLKHQASASILQTVLGYWNLRMAADQVEVAQRSVKLQGELLELTRELIKASDLPRADEHRSMASYADAQARLESAQRGLNEASVALARFMGVALDPAAQTIAPADSFPQPPDTLLDEDAAVAALVKMAVGQRYDRQAAVMFQEAGQILAKGAKLDTRRLLDLEGGFWGNAVAENKFSDLNRWIWRSGSGAVRFEMPFNNDQLEGQAVQADAQAAQRGIDAANLERNITLNVLRLSHSLRIAADGLKRAQESVRGYDQTIQDEQAKLKAGDSTLVDTILTEQQTTSARLALVNAQQQYASLLAQLRFEVGLIAAAADKAMSEDNLRAVPAPLQGRR